MREACQKILADVAALKPDSVIVIANIGGQIHIAYQYRDLHELVFNAKQLERVVNKVIEETEIRNSAIKQTNETIERIRRGDAKDQGTKA